MGDAFREFLSVKHALTVTSRNDSEIPLPHVLWERLNGRNPISIIVPCHRVIGASGGLTGFAGGLKAEAHLLNIETSKNEINLAIPKSRSGDTRALPLII
jgi:hypothetical protein